MAQAVSLDRIMELGMAFWGSKALLSAVELGVFSELAKGPQDAETLQRQIGLHPRSARDFFDALVALGMLDRQNGLYINTPETDRYLDLAKSTYLGGWLEMVNARLYPYWARLTEGLRTGLPQNEVRDGQNFLKGTSKNLNFSLIRTHKFMKAKSLNFRNWSF